MADPGAFIRKTREVGPDHWFAAIAVPGLAKADPDPPAQNYSRTSPFTAGIAITLLILAVAMGTAGGFWLGRNPSGTPVTVAEPAAAPPLAPCDGLAGALITAGGGNRQSPVGVVAAFEYAYYVDRNAQAALDLTTAEARLNLASLSTAIAALPGQTEHCLAATQISPTEVSVVLAVAGAGKRVLHRQVLSVTARAPHAITGFRQD